VLETVETLNGPILILRFVRQEIQTFLGMAQGLNGVGLVLPRSIDTIDGRFGTRTIKATKGDPTGSVVTFPTRLQGRHFRLYQRCEMA
jgi:hypothetical protein